MDEKQPCFVAGISKPPKRPSGEKPLSALLLEKGLRKGEHTCRDNDQDQAGQVR